MPENITFGLSWALFLFLFRFLTKRAGASLTRLNLARIGGGGQFPSETKCMVHPRQKSIVGTPPPTHTKTNPPFKPYKQQTKQITINNNMSYCFKIFGNLFLSIFVFLYFSLPVSSYSLSTPFSFHSRWWALCPPCSALMTLQLQAAVFFFACCTCRF